MFLLSEIIKLFDRHNKHQTLIHLADSFFSSSFVPVLGHKVKSKERKNSGGKRVSQSLPKSILQTCKACRHIH